MYVLDATCNNISATQFADWVSLVEQTWVSEENHWPAPITDKLDHIKLYRPHLITTWSHKVVSSKLSVQLVHVKLYRIHLADFEFANLVGICTEYTMSIYITYETLNVDIWINKIMVLVFPLSYLEKIGDFPVVLELI